MARVKIARVIDHLNAEMKKALAQAISQVAPEANIDNIALYKAFVRAVGRKCSVWERVPDQYVEE